MSINQQGIKIESSRQSFLSGRKTAQDLKSAEDAKNMFHFHAILYPNASLGMTGFKIILAIFAIYGLVMGTYFVSQGAWLIPGFYGVEILFVVWLFCQSIKRGRDFETVSLTDHELIIEEHSNRQGQKSWVLEPVWTHVKVEKVDAHRHVLKIISNSKGVILGEFLTTEEKQDFAVSLREALEDWKGNLHKQSSPT